MVEGKRKSLEELAKEVLDTQSGLVSKEDLQALFDSGDPNPAPNTPQAPAGPVPVPPTMAPTSGNIPSATPAETGTGEPNVMEFVPEKFRDKDVKSSMNKWTKSYSDLETELQKQKNENDNLNRIMKNLTEPSPIPAPAPVPGPHVPEEEMDDSAFFDKPKEAVAKVAAKVVAQAIMQYHGAMERSRYVESFRGQHTDFDQYRPEMLEVLRARPDLDQNAANLPTVFELAKQRKAQKLNEMRTELGLEKPTVPIIPSTATSVMMTEEKIAEMEARAVEKAKVAILEEVKRRKAASGTLGGGVVNPADRVKPTVTVVPKTEADVFFDEILQSGPKPLALLNE